ncbi:MAG: tetratricopeptide repeat protein [Pseudomonadota bacterium]
METLRTSEDEAAARGINAQLWEIWLTAPTAEAQELLDLGMERRNAHDLDGAIRAFEALIDMCPNYAEGYNQRAFALFLRQDYTLALIDLERALAITPDHIGALSGQALTLMGLGRDAEAQEVLRAALALNPWLSERHLLTEPEGEDI